MWPWISRFLFAVFDHLNVPAKPWPFEGQESSIVQHVIKNVKTSRIALFDAFFWDRNPIPNTEQLLKPSQCKLGNVASRLRPRGTLIRPRPSPHKFCGAVLCTYSYDHMWHLFPQD